MVQEANVIGNVDPFYLQEQKLRMAAAYSAGADPYVKKACFQKM